MAFAKVIPAVPEVTKVVQTAWPERIQLGLSTDEAQFLADILNRVGGSPTLSRRRYQEPISAALRSAGLTAEPEGTVDDIGQRSGRDAYGAGLYFTTAAERNPPTAVKL